MAAARKLRQAPDPLEKDIQSAVIDHWRLLGRPMTLVAAIPNANAHGQPGLTPGLGDLLVMGPDIPGGLPIAFMELKRKRRSRRSETGKLSPTEEAQAGFAILCAQLGILCPTVYGRDEPIEYLERWNIVRTQRYPEIIEATVWP
jgi:hypothetical protein